MPWYTSKYLGMSITKIQYKHLWLRNQNTPGESFQSPTISDLVFNSANFTAGFLVGVLATTTTFPWHDVSWFLQYFISKVILTACFSNAQTSILCTANVDTRISFIKRNFARYDRENDMFLFLLFSQLTNPFDILLWTLIFAHDLDINLHFW